MQYGGRKILLTLTLLEFRFCSVESD